MLYTCLLSAVYYCFNKYVTLKESNPNDGSIALTLNFQYYVDLYQTWLALGTCTCDYIDYCRPNCCFLILLMLFCDVPVIDELKCNNLHR